MKYDRMTLEEFMSSQAYKREYLHKLDTYEEEVKDELARKPYLSSRQVYDHLRERHGDFPAVSDKTVFNFVARIRDKHGIAKGYQESFRPSEKLPETDPGEYMQADFGEYWMRRGDTRRVKVYFFATVMSRSRQKFVYFSHSTGVSERQLRELRQLAWLNQAYNLILIGPSGTGRGGYVLGALATYNKWLKADLLAIDDIMLFPVKKEESASFFNLVNSLHEKTSVIITTNKAPTEWVQTLNDEVLATAIIDRLLYRCEVIKLAGTSYRLENRKTIFHNETTSQESDKNRQ